MNTNEHIVTYFLKVEKAVKRLECANVKYDKTELLRNALYTIKESREMEQALKDWDKEDTANKTWSKAKDYFSEEFANR